MMNYPPVHVTRTAVPFGASDVIALNAVSPLPQSSGTRTVCVYATSPMLIRFGATAAEPDMVNAFGLPADKVVSFRVSPASSYAALESLINVPAAVFWYLVGELSD